MILVHTTIPLGGDGESVLLDRIGTLVEHARAEDGTVRYRAARDLTDPTLVHFFEQYEDAAAAEAHTESAPYRRFVEALPGAVDGEIETVQCQVDDDRVGVTSFTAADAVASLE